MTIQNAEHPRARLSHDTRAATNVAQAGGEASCTPEDEPVNRAVAEGSAELVLFSRFAREAPHMPGGGEGMKSEVFTCQPG